MKSFLLYKPLPACIGISFLNSIFLFLSFSIVAFAQNPPFFLAPKWQTGDSRRFELSKGKQVFKDNKQSIENESRQIITMTVLEKTAKGFIISARYENTYGSSQPIDVHYAIGHNGDFKGITNMIDIQKSFYAIFDDLTATAASTPSVARSVGEMRQLMTSDNYITNSFFQELGLIHQFYNNSFTIDSLENYKTQLPNLFDPTGEPFPANATLLAKREGAISYIRHTVEPDISAIQQQAKRYLERMSGTSSKLSVGTQTVTIMDKSAFDTTVFDEDFCAFDLNSGWISAFQRKRTIVETAVKTVEFVFLKEIR